MLSKTAKIILLICAVTLFWGGCAYSHNSSGYSNTNTMINSGFSDDFFNMLKRNQKKQQTPEMAAAKEELKKRKIPATVDGFVKNVKKNNIEVLQIFIDAGFDVNTDFYTDYPIYYAAKHNRLEATEFLLKHGANPNLGFNPPLNEAIKVKNQEIANMLIEHGAKVNRDDFMSGQTLLYLALKKKMYQTAHLMIKRGAKIDTASKFLIESGNLYDILELDKNSF